MAILQAADRKRENINEEAMKYVENDTG